MTEYIDRNALIEHMKKDPLFDLVEQYGITGVIESFPAADVQPVKHGKNIKKEYPTLFQCSVCGCEDWDTSEVNYGKYNYCPNCGAMIDGGENG